MSSHGSYRTSVWLGDEDVVYMLLTTMHDDCRAGFGDSPGNCTARRELLDARAQRGWTWPVPDGERSGV